MTTWKRLLLISAGFGAGFAVCVAAIVGSFCWCSSRPKPWNKNALKATFATMEFDTRPQEASYKVDFMYNLQNTTERNYDFNSSNFNLLAVLADANALSKDFGHYQAEDQDSMDPRSSRHMAKLESTSWLLMNIHRIGPRSKRTTRRKSSSR